MLEKISDLPIIHRIKHKSVQNFIFLAFIQASNILISLITMPLLITSIGVDQFGLVNLALSIIILANILVGFGYNLSGPREVAIRQNDKEPLSHVVSNIIFSKIIMAALAAIIILVGIFGFGLFREYQIILAFSLLLLFSEAIFPLWFFQGMEKMKLISVANIFSKLLFLMGIILFIHRPEQAKWVNFLLGGTGITINILLLLFIHYGMDIHIYKPRLKELFSSLRDNVLLFLSNLASHISINGGLIILSFFATAEILGMFSLAEKITMVIRLFPALIIQAIYPNASRLYEEGMDVFLNFVRKVYGISIMIGFMISAFTYWVAPYAVYLLSQSELPPAVAFLQILAFVPFLACLNIANIMMLLVTDQKGQLFKASWMMCVYMLIASILLTDRYGGMGLSYALLSVEVVVFIISTILLYTKSKAMTVMFYKL